MSFRLPPQPEEWIDRSRTLMFRFEGRSYHGFEGDTISSALAACGVRMLGRSFKYHRPRGIYSFANHDVNCLLENGQATNIRADVTPLSAGVELHSVNTVGGLRRDWARFMNRLGPMFPVGFYYKTFHRPLRWFPFWERRMREMAGLGRVEIARPRVRSPKAFAFCDVLVVGAGPAGLSAAIAARQAGASVVLVDEQRRPGGSLHYQSPLDATVRETRESLLQQAHSSQVEVRPATCAVGFYADHLIALADPQRLTKVRAKSVVLATGGYEQPAVFGNNDLPGVMLGTAAQRLVHLYAVAPGRHVVALVSGDEGLRMALDLADCGVNVTAVVDLRPSTPQSPARSAIVDRGISLLEGYAVVRALAAAGHESIRGVEVAPLSASGQIDSQRQKTLPADALLVSVGWASADGLLCQAGGKVGYDSEVHQFLPVRVPHGVHVAGRAAGLSSLKDRLADGAEAGRAAAKDTGFDTPATAGRTRPTGNVNHPHPIFPHAEAKSFIDFDEDVQYKDVIHSVQEGFDQVELLKRYSTFGMGPSQGKLANTNAIRLLAKATGRSVAETGTTTARPFIQPVPLELLAGRGFHVQRRTAIDDWHDRRGAVWMTAGEWRRPAYYKSGDRESDQQEAVAREVSAVRQRVGLIDVSTLGKIEIWGDRAGEFLDRVYTGRFSNLAVGMSRYGLACDESGVVIDDGVVFRLAPDRYYFTTTTTNAVAIYRELTRYALLWDMGVTLVNLTGQVAAMNLAGPLARKVLGGCSDLKLSPAEFPFLASRLGNVAGAPARILRVGFVGELGYEIHVPFRQALHVWRALFEQGQPHGLAPFGVEAQRVLRLEKGHVIVGQDTDGLTIPAEAGLTWAVKLDKPFFVGQRSLKILARKPISRQLVGFALPADVHSAPLECNLVIDKGDIAGRVTSITRSPTLNQWIGLAFVRPNQSTPGTTFAIRTDDGSSVPATVVPLPFYDPKHERQHVA